MRPIAESYEKQRRFITDASHEIKTPLAIIEANTEVIEMDNGESEWTDSIRNQVKRLTGLTEKLVFLSRMEEEDNPLTMVDFSLSDAVSETAQSFEAVAAAQQKTLTSEIEPRITYHGDEASLRQCVSLLLDNAMKYSTENGAIRLTLSRSGKNITLTLWNSAQGLTPGKQDILFERFYRPDSSRSRQTGGSGIGLSVAQAIVLAHKGKINARSDDGVSILFTITL
jgi:signal transduction histidine kinase